MSEMSEEVKIKAPKRWWSGPSRREHDFLAEVLRLAQNGKNMDDLRSQISGRISLLRDLENKYDWSTVVAWALGLFGGMGLILGLLSESIRDMGFFMFFLSVFHFWEWFYASWFQPEQVTVHSFMLTHSREFHMAMGLAFGEYFLEWLIFPGMKSSLWIMIPAIIVIASGQAIRTVAMYTAGRSFNHLVQEEKKEDHVLVTEGIYQYLRHPSYFGWFWWSIGMACLLGNPITIGAFAYASWHFFADRIPFEEEALVKMFGQSYIEYRKRTPTGIPMIK
eukprot:TRINITY_DN3822_c0_g2_i1.p1 TRINITY_DN3822_c0_g2~~TRINITY_DN3822_c0_g2_i1.p1  ORF type:complete len:292 (-),score=50.25 TRINITY_DN3822_c0_g2_i1:63-896(-)